MKSNEISSIENPVYSVSQLNREVKELLNLHFLKVLVEGEISNLSTPSSGHIYFSLKDSKSQIRCAMFRSQQRNLGFVPENGLQVLVKAQVSLYEPRGDFQLIVQAMEEAGDGALRRAFEALKKKLAAEGLFDSERKQQLPYLPKAISVITSPTGAAIRDILSVLRRRFALIPVIVYPVAVQGENAKYEIVEALEIANARKECDVIIVARGGGSLEDLWAFNEEMVARAIDASKIPVVSGVGHEVDFTIADFVADFRAPTPSAAAEHCTPEAQELLQYFKLLENRLIQQMHRIVTGSKQAIEWLTNRLKQQSPEQQLGTKAQRLDNLELRLNQVLQSIAGEKKAQLTLMQHRLWQLQPASQIQSYKMQQQYLTERLIASVNRKLDGFKHKVANTSQTLHAVSPLATLSRGYAIVTELESKQIVHSVSQLQPGDLVHTRLAEGRFTSKIEKIEND